MEDNNVREAGATNSSGNLKSDKKQGEDQPSEGFFKLFGRLMKNKSSESTSKADKLQKLLEQYNVQSLPQKFVIKHLGSCPSQKLGGLKHVKEYVDLLLEANKKKKELPLAELEVTLRGVDIVPRGDPVAPLTPPGADASVPSYLSGPEHVPIEFISYGVQDSRHPKMFAFFRVRELSMRTKKTECYVFKCDSSATCKKLALSLALAFKEYGKSHKGQPHQFKVDLNSTEGGEAETIVQSETPASKEEPGASAEVDA